METTQYPWTDEWIKIWYIYTIEYYSAIKKNEIMPFTVTWMQLEIIILSKSERERQIPYDQQSHSRAYIQTKLFLKKTHAPVCSLQHYSQ